MKQLLQMFLFMLCCITGYSQQVVSSAGATSQTSSGGISYTIGEAITETHTASGKTLTQGFQQTKLVITAIHETKDLGYTLTAYPNPANDFVKLSVSDSKVNGLRYVLYDLNGKIISSKQLDNTEMVIPFSDAASASYILKVFNGQQEVKSFKIIKQ